MIFVSKDLKPHVELLPFELVERKGVGHPDTIADAIAERASMYYSQYFHNKYDRIAHHWFDKVMLIGGSSNIEFGCGEVLKPYRIIFAGKAAKKYNDELVPLDEILFNAAKDVLSEVLTGFDAEKHLVIINEIVDYHGAGRINLRYQPMSSKDLVSLVDTNLVSNDCNLLSGFAPLSRLERIVYDVEQYINGKEFKKIMPQTGWDVKLVGSREYDTYKLLINIPFLAGQVEDVKSYFEYKNKAVKLIEQFISDKFDVKVELTVNPQDNNEKYYLTALGSVADTGDVGAVGRGNRINGLITPMRTMSIEAPAGKNPFDHTGKIYGHLVRKLSDEIYDEIKKPVEIHIFTSKEAKLNNPDHVSVQISDWTENEKDVLVINKIVKKRLDEVNEITKEFIFTGTIMW